MQIAVPKDRDVSGGFYNNVILKKSENKNDKITPQNRSLACPCLLHDNAPAQTSSTVAQFLKSERSMYCRTLPPAQTWPRALFPLS